MPLNFDTCFIDWTDGEGGAESPRLPWGWLEWRKLAAGGPGCLSSVHGACAHALSGRFLESRKFLCP